MKNEIMQIVDQICNTESTNCRNLNKCNQARELMNLVNIPQNADIQEIPLDWNRQVVILFLIPEDKENYYSLFAGIGNNGKFYFELSITGKNPYSDNFYFLDEEEILPIDYFVNKISITEERGNHMNNNKIRKHGTYDTTGIMCADLRKVSGTAGSDVNFAYIYPDGNVDIVTKSNTHYGYGYVEGGMIYDNANRSVFEII